ncbi:transcriptional regulator, TraR/DksA family [Thiohalospira halophila DSM 15071]|uniref:Transcriptional regulator, TraR/DksA family n=1 Tax=Thiohalospira halophila DSM 15071 TaxID=1123397 RepID=A0A1I1TFP2_9GAMM|nr:TraR/DksA C4-type zinc finger protein [Thiohalospira halophila]SFD55173.1 transcriptional regulator, TraR/DksA family [Thiohalospira halophila DSM 15071]
MGEQGVDVEARRADLERERAELVADQAERRDAEATVELDQQRQGRLSRMDALQGQAMAKASAERAQQRLRLIDAALVRIEEGEYGLCRECDEPIAPARLAADPAAALCIDCAARREA